MRRFEPFWEFTAGAGLIGGLLGLLMGDLGVALVGALFVFCAIVHWARA